MNDPFNNARYLSETELAEFIRILINAQGSIREWCRHGGIVSHSHVGEFLAGKRGPSTELLNAIGAEKRYMITSGERTVSAKQPPVVEPKILNSPIISE